MSERRKYHRFLSYYLTIRREKPYIIKVYLVRCVHSCHQNYRLNVFTIRSGVDICFLQLILSLEDWEPERHAFDQRTIFLLLRVNLDLFDEGSCQFLLINLRHLLEDSTEFKNELDDLILCDLLTLDALVE